MLTATSIGTSAALAWSIASTVCGMTPSSAATTSTTMSVTSAPRARIAVNAAWPGVSMKLIVLPLLVHLVGADVLGDPAGLAGDDLGLADRVEQRGLAVVDVAHDRDDRRAVDEVVVGVVEDGRLGLLLGGADDLDLAVERLGEHLNRLVGERLGERRHLAELHQLLDHIGAADAEDLGDLANGRAGGHLQRRLLDLDMRPERRLFEQRPAAASATAARRAARRRVRHLVAARSLRVDDDAAALLLPRASAAAIGG